MGHMAGGRLTPLGGAKVVQLNDSAGTDSLTVKDSDGFTLLRLDSKGNLKVKGTVGKV